MKTIIDIEANGLHNPTKVWCIVCKRVESGAINIFRNLTDDQTQANEFKEYAKTVTKWIAHNGLGYDFIVLSNLGLLDFPPHTDVVDTLIVSKLVNYSRPGGHSIEQYGEEFGLEKMDIGKSVAGYNPFFNQWSQKMEDYCARDVEISALVYNNFRYICDDPTWHSAIELEQRFQLIVNDLHNNGFGFNTKGCNDILNRVNRELQTLDEKILTAFPPREVLIREFTPKLTKFGTISRSSVPRSLLPDIHKYEAGKTYRHTRLEPFNPSSHKQLIQVLNEAKWKPEDKTTTHVDVEREVALHKRNRAVRDASSSLVDLASRLEVLRITGWKINENNLSTLPATAPEPARLLAKRILLESRRRTLTEWLGLVGEDGRIHGSFYGIGAWTHRMSHQKPNTANIPREFKEDGTQKLLGKELRSLWCAPKNRLLVGVDAEGIQLRIFAHYIDEPEFTDALIRGKKSDKSDPHSLNQRILGDVCQSRQAAKRFVYALLLGGGISKLAVILGCSVSQAREALDRLLERYTGFAKLRGTGIPKDAKKGFFIGLDGRQVSIPGESQRDREHLCMSGYLQNGEAIVIKRAAILADERLREEKKLKQWMFIDIVHDELQSETSNRMSIATRVAKVKAECIEEAGKYYKLRCPMAGSYFNEDTKDFTIGTNWYSTH